MSPQILVVLGVALASCVLLALAIAATWQAGDQVMAAARARTQSMVYTLNQHTARTMDSVDMLLRAVAKELGPDPQDAVKRSSVTALLAELTRNQSYVRAIQVLERDTGAAIFEFVPGRDIDLGAVAADQAPRSEGGLHIGKPVQDASGTMWLVPVSRRIKARDGIPGNAVVAYVALDAFQRLYANVPPEEADVVVALGGDGLMLQTLHRFMGTPKPIYGMNRGSVGFLMNDFHPEDLPDRLAAAQRSVVHPLLMVARNVAGETHQAHAINEVSMLRQTHQAAKLCIRVDDHVRLPELVADGVLVATPAGSTAYNYSAFGPVLPIGAEVLALTAIAPFRPRRWRGALLPKDVCVRFDVIEGDKRPVRADADSRPVQDVLWVEVASEPAVRHHLLFDPGHGLDERLIREQFA